MAKFFRALCLASVFFAFFRVVQFTASFWNVPWPHVILTIDGGSFLQSAFGASWANLLSFADIYHSPGYAIYLRALFALLGSLEALVHASKVLFVLMFAASLAMIFRLGSRCFHERETAFLALALFAFSESWKFYCNMIQYEVLAGFLMLVFLLLLTGGEKGRGPVRGLALGFVLAALVLLHAKYALLLAVPAVYAAWSGRGGSWSAMLRAQGRVYSAALAPLLAWSLFASLARGQLVALKTGNDFLFRLANNPNAEGYGFPHPPIGEPAGLPFVLAMPGRWLWLVGQRFLYLMGIKRDVWALPPGPPEEIGALSHLSIASTLLFFAGLALALWRLRRGEAPPAQRAALLLLGAVLLPPLALFGSERFLVPVIPVMTLFQASALVALGAFLRRKDCVIKRQ